MRIYIKTDFYDYQILTNFWGLQDRMQNTGLNLNKLCM